MDTAQLIIVCVTALAALMIVTHAIGKRTTPAAPAERRLLAAEIAAGIAERQNDVLQAQLTAVNQIVENTTRQEARMASSSPPTGARVAVHKLDGQTLRGEIVAQDGREIVLEKVDVITAGDAQPTGGRFHISRDRIDSIQEL